MKAIAQLCVAALVLSGLAFSMPKRAEAATEKVLILARSVVGGSSSIEANEAAAKGFAVDVVDDATWSSMTTAQFASYRAIILGDPDAALSSVAAAEANTATWGAAVTGNIVIIGTDPVGHASQGGEQLVRRGVDFAVDKPGKTGLFATLSEYYHGVAPGTPVKVLDALKPGGFTVRGVGCYDAIKIVADSPALDGVTDASLSNWGCSVHEAFDTWPSDFGVLAVDTDAGSNYEAADGTTGRPYILARPGGGVLGASEAFGPANPSQKRPPDCQSGSWPVNCRTGNFWHTFSDLGIAGRGPGLHLERTYNALGADSDGSFGYGWSSSYTMGLTTSATGTVTVDQENGSTVSFRPDGAGAYTAPPRVFATLVANADGTYTFTRNKREVFTFSGAGALVSVRDLNGHTTDLAYDAAGRLATVTDAAGRSLRIAHGPDGRIASVTDPADRVVSYAYDAAGNMTSSTDVAGGVTAFTYDADHRALTMTDPRGGVVRNTYDTAGRITAQTDPADATTSFSYSDEGTTITDARGNVTVQRYTSGKLTSITKGDGTAAEATWSYTYNDATFVLTSITDPRGNVTLLGYDAEANLTSSIDPLGRETKATYDALDNPTSVTDASGVTTTVSYDGAGNPTAVSRPLAGTTLSRTVSLAYDPDRPGDVTALTDANAKVWSFAYDGAGNLTRATDPLAQATTYTHDLLGRVTTQVAPKGNVVGADPAAYTTAFTYNAFGDLVAATDPVGGVVRQGFDANRNRTSHTDADDKTTSYAYDAADRLTTLTRPDGTVLKSTYDAEGNLTAQLDAAAKATTYAYDAVDRVVSMTDPLNRTTRFGYDAAGNRTTLTDPAGQVTTFGYDAADQLTGVGYSDTTTPAVSYAYDALGRRASMSDGTGASSYEFDSLGRLTRHTDGAGEVVAYGYDLKGQLTSLTYPGAKVVIRTFDDAGHLTAVKDWLNETTTFSYDANGNQTGQSSPNATSSSLGFDAADRLMGIAHGASEPTTHAIETTASTSFAAFDYTRTAAGLLASASLTGVTQDTEAYGYTEPNQLASVNTASYGYDVADNLTKLASGATQSFDAANQLTSSSAGSFAYDSRGNRTQGPAASGGVATYGYDQANRLVSAQSATAAGAGLAGGTDHSLAVKADGTVWASGLNSSGQLGNGTTTNSSLPVQVSNLTGVVSVGAGGDDSVALRSDGTVWGWGLNNYGQLGDGTTTNRPAPVEVKNLTGASAVSAGFYHTLALKSDGTVWAWGLNNYGQLGNGTTTTSSVPVQVANLTGVTAIAAGYHQNYALKSDGTVWAWGLNNYGQLGNGTTTTSSVPVQVANLTGVSAIAGGYYHGLAVKADATVASWGLNQYGQLGNGTTTASNVPVQVANLAAATAVSAGAYQSYALKSDATAASWGWNDYGQLGDGTKTTRTAPVQVSGLSGVAAVEGGRHFGLAAKTDGTVWGWGYNRAGQLGTGTTTKPNAGQLTPAQSSFSGGVVDGSTTSSTYAYNGDGLRTSKTTGATTSGFVWAVADAVPPLLSDGTRSFIHGPNGPVKQIDASGAATYLHLDQLGSIRVATDTAGAVVGTYTFDAYGNQTAKTGSAATPLGFAGEYTDVETGFQYLRARYYDPATGQFLTRDPIEALTREPYGYVGGNPLNFTDPLGLNKCEVGANPLRWVGNAVDCTVKVGRTVGDIARSEGAQIAKDAFYGASTITSGLAPVSATVAVAIPVTAPVTGFAAGVFAVSSAMTGIAGTAIECTDGGPAFDCLAGIAAAGIPLVTPGVVRQVARKYGDRSGLALNAALNNFGFAANAASKARSVRMNGLC